MTESSFSLSFFFFFSIFPNRFHRGGAELCQKCELRVQEAPFLSAAVVEQKTKGGRGRRRASRRASRRVGQGGPR